MNLQHKATCSIYSNLWWSCNSRYHSNQPKNYYNNWTNY